MGFIFYRHFKACHHAVPSFELKNEAIRKPVMLFRWQFVKNAHVHGNKSVEKFDVVVILVEVFCLNVQQQAAE
ncbi:MAG: hypothetical protein LBF42_01325 [Puniceicoccales bacterium]|jgi:hypothetical protein|nr:hypothetical protein [Puniceicoccales bacterium]